MLEEARKVPTVVPESPTTAPGSQSPNRTPAVPAPVPPKPVDTGYLGAFIIDDAAPTKGATIERVVPGSPAEAAGLAAGDLVTSLNGKPITNGRQLIQQLGTLVIAARVEFAVQRNKTELKISVMLSKPPHSVLK
jgi:S1-C subfamily serine protease